MAYQNTPEMISHYMGQQFKREGVCSVIDVFCGDGGNSIQLAL